MKKFALFLILVVFALAVASLVSAEKESEPETLEVGLGYGANQHFSNELNIDTLIQKAKEQDFWIRTGTEPNTVYYKGSTVCSNQACSFYKEEEFFKGNRLYAYSDNTFVLYIERDGYEYQISRHKNNMTNIIIGVNPKANVEAKTVKDDIKNMILSLGIFENPNDIAFTFSQGKVPEQVARQKGDIGDIQSALPSGDTEGGITSTSISVGILVLIIAFLIWYKFYKK